LPRIFSLFLFGFQTYITYHLNGGLSNEELINTYTVGLALATDYAKKVISLADGMIIMILP
jgi:hypothetical protein